MTRRLFLASCALTGLSLASCGKGDGRLPTFPVSGKVVLPDGKPAQHATVVFHPVGVAGPEVDKPRGKVAADGTFKLTTYDGDDGAPEGEYKVTVELWLFSGRADEGPTNRLPAMYAQPEKSGLVAAVTAGGNRVNGGGWCRPASDLPLLIGSSPDGTTFPGPAAINATNGELFGVYPHPFYGTLGSGQIYGFHTGGVNALFADGSVRFLKQYTSIRVVAAMVSRNGGEVFIGNG